MLWIYLSHYREAHYKSLQYSVFLITFILIWTISVLMGVGSSRITVLEVTRAHWMLWWVCTVSDVNHMQISTQLITSWEILYWCVRQGSPPGSSKHQQTEYRLEEHCSSLQKSFRNVIKNKSSIYYSFIRYSGSLFWTHQITKTLVFLFICH